MVRHGSRYYRGDDNIQEEALLHFLVIFDAKEGLMKDIDIRTDHIAEKICRRKVLQYSCQLYISTVEEWNYCKEQNLSTHFVSQSTQYNYDCSLVLN